MEAVVATMKPELTHCARSWPSAKWWLMSGMATFTMVDDMMDAIVPIITDSNSSHR